jgi:hypothetical protein
MKLGILFMNKPKPKNKIKNWYTEKTCHDNMDENNHGRVSL